MINRSGLGIACALAAAMCYGLVPNFVRGGFNNGVGAIDATFFRTAFVGVALAILGILQDERFSIPRAGLASFAVQTLATLIVSVSYLASVQFIPVGLAAIIFFTFPVIIMLSAPLVEGHSPGAARILVAAFAFAGLAVSVGPSFESLDIRGILLAAAASVFCAVQFFSGRSISRFMTPAAFGSLVHLIILPATFLIAFYVGNGSIGVFPGGHAAAAGLVFMLGVGAAYVGGYYAHMLSLRFAPASTVAPYFNLEPMVATAVAGLLLGERLAPSQYVGGGMVLAALAASSFVARRKLAAS
jgi:drug/metabolite transporter (DMT)-like permease